MKKYLVAIATSMLALTGCGVVAPIAGNYAGDAIVAGISNSGSNSKALENINSIGEARSAVRRGMTKTQVQEKMGKPNSISTKNETTVWVYRGTNLDLARLWSINNTTAANQGHEGKTLTITFNGAGRVKRVDFSMETR